MTNQPRGMQIDKQKKEQSQLDASADETRIDQLMHAVEYSLELAKESSDLSAKEAAIQDEIDRLEVAVAKAHEELKASRERNEALARAQADAIVRSAEIIEELEETRQQLVSARTAAEKSAREKERLAETIFAKTNDAVMIFKDERCVSCNQNVLKLFDLEEDRLIQKWPPFFSVDRLVGGSDAVEKLLTLYRSSLHGEPGSIEIGTLRPGKPIWCEVKMNSFEMDGSIHVLATISDISARHDFEEALRQHRDFLNSIINAVPDPLCVVDQTNRLVVANDSFCKSIRRSREEAVGSSALEFGESIERSLRKATASEGGQRNVQEEILTRESSGRDRYFAVRRGVFRDSLTQDSYLIAISRDVTEQRQREDRLGLLASVFKNIAEGVAILSTDGNILEANPRFVELLGCSDPTGKSLREAIELKIDNLQKILESVQDGKNWAGKIAATNVDGRERWFWLSLSLSTSNYTKESQVIALFSDVTELKRSQRQLERLALNDNLTGLPNRRFFIKQINQMLKQCDREERRLAIVFMDLDDFKSINDISGHGTGDRLLIEVGKLLKELLGSESTVARFGGDEFAAVFEFHKENYEHTERRLNALVDRFQRPIFVDSKELTTGVSVGTAFFPEHGEDTETLMSNADIAMYAAKSAGKNHVRLFSREMQARTEYRHSIQLDLRRALNEGGITLAYQPKVRADDLGVAGCEALSRWIRPDGTSIPPSEFISIAEESGLILQLGEFVLRQAAQTAKDWYERGIQLLPIAVNVSPQQLRKPNFVHQLAQIVSEFGVSASWLELEITENAVIEDIQFAIETFRRLHDLGFRIAIDDFGTGYSSLNYLRHFRIDTLKIDRSFVSEITSDRNLAAISNAIISLGHGLGLDVVAEGVETVEQQAFLANSGCDYLQGYLFSRPVFKADAEEWATKHFANNK